MRFQAAFLLQWRNAISAPQSREKDITSSDTVKEMKVKSVELGNGRNLTYEYHSHCR